MYMLCFDLKIQQYYLMETKLIHTTDPFSSRLYPEVTGTSVARVHESAGSNFTEQL